MERIDVSELKDFPQLTAETIRKKKPLVGIKLVKVFLIWQSILIGMVITKSELQKIMLLMVNIKLSVHIFTQDTQIILNILLF